MKNVLIISLRYVLLTTFLLMSLQWTGLTGEAQSDRVATRWPVTYNKLKIDGLEIFYREAGDPRKPTILLLHGFPTSSHMFRNLIPLLADKYHIVAPDYPGFGYSSAPGVSELNYSFDLLAKIMDQFTVAKGLNRYSLYVQDYGAPVGYRLAVKHPERVQALIVQNGNAYEEGLRGFWNPIKAYWSSPTAENADKLRDFLKVEATKWQYTHGTRNVNRISPDSWTFDQALLDRPGNQEIQLKLFLDYGSNPPLYPQWQEYFRKHQPPTLIVWGKNDEIFPAEGAEPYKRDLKNIEFQVYGQFGENLTTEGIEVNEALVGERWQVGTAILEVSEPRIPCWRLGVRMEDNMFPRRFTEAQRPGTYLRIVVEGHVRAGDEIRVVERPDHNLMIRDVFRIYTSDRHEVERLLAVPQLSEGWRRWADALVEKAKSYTKVECG